MKLSIVLKNYLLGILIISLVFAIIIHLKNEPSKKNTYKIGIIDGSIKFDQSVFDNMKKVTKNFVSETSTIDEEHGTSVFGIIALEHKNNNITIYSAEVLSNGVAKQDNIIKGIYWCIKQDVDLINISIDIKNISYDLDKAIKQAEKKKIPILIANGNGNYSNLESTKSKRNNVIYVGSLNHDKTIANRENRNADVYFIGENISSIDQYYNKKKYSGSSYATAIASSKIIKKIGHKSNNINKKIIRKIEKKGE